MSEMTVTVPGLTIADDSAWELRGQEAPLVVAGLTVGTCRVVHAHVTLDGLDMTLEVDERNPAAEAFAVTARHAARPLTVSVGVRMFATDTESRGRLLSATLDGVAYPADDPDYEE